MSESKLLIRDAVDEDVSSIADLFNRSLSVEHEITGLKPFRFGDDHGRTMRVFQRTARSMPPRGGPSAYLLYTGVTRGKRLVVLLGQRKALAIGVNGAQTKRRWSKLCEWLDTTCPADPSLQPAGATG